MSHNKFPKGSEWNKWDLHIHTPESLLNNGFGECWDTYVQTLFKKAIENNIVSIGITDYYIIDGYKKLRQEYLNSPSKLAELFTPDEIEYIKGMFIFPNIEFRINKLVLGNEKDLKWNRKVNFHLLISDKVAIEDIEENLLNKLLFEIVGTNDGTPQKQSITKRNLINLGKELKEQHTEFKEHSDIFVGMVNASIDTEQLVEVLKSQSKIFKGKYLLGLPADEDLSQVSWNSQGHLARKVLIQKSHLLFSSNPKTIEFGLGYFHKNPQEFEKEFNSLKPCVWGSDAHDFNKLFKPDKDRYTWLKATPTFEGLKQVVYEPDERVKIQLNKPEEKTPYLVIDKVRFVDNSGLKIFSPEWIDFNDNLNVVIGGKSSGKSLILYHVAKAIDTEQTKNKTIFSNSDYDEFISEKPFDLEVLWKNGDTDKLSDDEKLGQITFVPQMYINHLAEKNGEEHLYELIDSILLQNDEYRKFIEGVNQRKNDTTSNISRNIESLLSLTKSANDLTTEINKLGTKEQISIEIKRLADEVEKLKKQSGFTDIESKKFESLEKRKKELEANIKKSEAKKSSLEIYEGQIKENQKITINTVNNRASQHLGTPDEETRDLIRNLKTDLENRLNESYQKFYDDTEIKLKEISDGLKTANEELEKTIKLLSPFQAKIKNKEMLERVTKSHKAQENKLLELNKKVSERNRTFKAGKDNNEELFNNYTTLLDLYKEINSKLQEPEFKVIGEGLELVTKLQFDTDRFSSSFSNLFDRRANFHTVFSGRFDDANNFIFNLNQHVPDIRIIFDKIRKEKDIPVRFRTGMNPDEKYSKLFDDYFKINYSIQHKGDNILKMSPGKRGLVLLQLILHISNATHPILIDQPEDNLDNRTIYNELKQFVKSKKVQRQIIIVTHNANLVVSTDAENVIVANQSGQQTGKDKKEYKFEYVSGALENTFIKEDEEGILYQYGIREHVCDILEGGREAFKKREQKYGFSAH